MTADKGPLGTVMVLHQSYVQRWVVAPMYRPQSVAEHAYRVTLIARHLATELGLDVNERNVVTGMALFHDAPEVLTGDMPGPGKAVQWPLLDPLSSLVKVADAIETGTWFLLWGNPGAWQGHPYNEVPRRDVSKIRHYGQAYPHLIWAAENLWRDITGKEMEKYDDD